MENYLSQLLSRNEPGNSDLLQPDSLPMQDKGDIEESFVEEPPDIQEFPAKAEAMFQPGFLAFEKDSQSYIEQKNIHHHYLQQYFTHVVSDEEGNKISTAAIIKQKEKQPSGMDPGSTVPDLKSLNKPEAQHTLPIYSIKEVPAKKDLTVPTPHPLLSPDSVPKASMLVPAVWLLPPAPALTAAPLLMPSKNKQAPSLMIGKILIEVLPAKPVPPRVINRSSPFQTTVSKSSSSSIAFGLGQL